MARICFERLPQILIFRFVSCFLCVRVLFVHVGDCYFSNLDVRFFLVGLSGSVWILWSVWGNGLQFRTLRPIGVCV